MRVVELHAGSTPIHAELAEYEGDRMLGLMFRRELAPDHGMLFVFDDAQRQCMWMRNTYIPLSVAFLDSDGAIINLEEMDAQTDNSHCAARPALFALEMSARWFAQHNMKPGVIIQGVVESARH